VIPR